MRKLLSYTRRAVEDYEMIKDGDKIAVGISGGKDSLTLLCVLAKLREFYPKKFDIIGLSLDLGFEGADFSGIQRLCDDIGVEFAVQKTDIAEVVFNIRKEKNPCSLCAKMRRGGLNSLAVEKGCNKVALGHHNDDFLETFFLSLFYEGRINTFKPVTYLSRMDIEVLRPFLYVPEWTIIDFAARRELPVMHNPCPANGATKRQEMKEFIRQKQKEDKDFKTKIMNAIRS